MQKTFPALLKKGLAEGRLILPVHRLLTRTTLRVMQLTAIFLFILALHVSARSSSQTVTINVTNVPVSKVFDEIKRQTGYLFVYNKKLINEDLSVSVRADKLELNNVLEKILNDKDLEYSIRNRTVFIGKKNEGKIIKPSANILLALPPVKGIVRGPDGQPIAGANVVVKGTKRGITTNIDGSFAIDAKDGDIIIISSIGYEQKEITVSSESITISVILNISTSKLDEIRIIAYGTTSKRLSTSATTGITADDIKTQPVNNPLLALAGRVPGVTVEQATGLPGSGVKIRIQGINSIIKGNDPFYVIDGVPYASSLLATGSIILGGTGQDGSDEYTGQGSPLSFINPLDIESIEILKDADATSIYGSRAANGAILITTKKGKAGSTSLDVNFQKGIGTVAKKLDLLNTAQYLAMRKEAYTNDGSVVPSLSSPVEEKNFTNYDLTVYDQERYTDWQKVLIGGSANYTDLQTSVSGGSNQTTFRLNGGYHRETTVFPGDFADVKASVGINVNHTSSNQKFKVQLSASYLNDDNRLPGDDLTRTAIQLAPNAPALTNTDGSLNWERYETNSVTGDSVSSFNNPLRFIQSKTSFKTNNVLGNANLSYNIFSHLTARINVGYSKLNSNEFLATPLNYFSPEERATESRSASYGSAEIRNWIMEPQLEYNNILGSGTFQALLGNSFQESNNDRIFLSGSGYPNDAVLEDMRAATSLRVNGLHILSKYKYAAVFGKLNYNILNKYILNITARRDGSSRFGSANQFHTFGAIGAAWLFSSEGFVSDHLHFISMGKLRGSFGTTGNDQIGNYSFLNIYNVIAGANSYNGYNGLIVSGHYNPYLQWELTKKFQAGFDLGFLSDRILLSTNFYRNQSSNQLLTYTLPLITGFGSVAKNFPATVRNTGWEFAINTTNIKSENLTWTSTFNLTIGQNKLVRFDNLQESPYKEQLVVGASVNVFKLFDYAGIDPETGKVQFRNAEGLVIPENDADFDKDRVIKMNPSPKYFGGLSNTFSYRGFDLSFLFQFTSQMGNILKLPGVLGENINQRPYVLNRWQKPGDETDVPLFSVNTGHFFAASYSTYNNARVSYIRLKNASLSWTFPRRWIESAKIKNLRMFVQGQNLLTITKYPALDPETLSNSTLPPLRVITFGAQITL
jgi:TonB-dependent starch-binding outer membrane protein SusC